MSKLEVSNIQLNESNSFEPINVEDEKESSDVDEDNDDGCSTRSFNSRNDESNCDTPTSDIWDSPSKSDDFCDDDANVDGILFFLNQNSDLYLYLYANEKKMLENLFKNLFVICIIVFVACFFFSINYCLFI